ncbi:hypothetical protein DOT_2627 [Desulfosporosinus sp. OT]|nr:hypothetical protein DOT_2627 [Desulfosporosinus sp. OT]
MEIRVGFMWVLSHEPFLDDFVHDYFGLNEKIVMIAMGE